MVVDALAPGDLPYRKVGCVRGSRGSPGARCCDRISARWIGGSVPRVMQNQGWWAGGSNLLRLWLRTDTRQIVLGDRDQSAVDLEVARSNRVLTRVKHPGAAARVTTPVGSDVHNRSHCFARPKAVPADEVQAVRGGVGRSLRSPLFHEITASLPENVIPARDAGTGARASPDAPFSSSSVRRGASGHGRRPSAAAVDGLRGVWS